MIVSIIATASVRIMTTGRIEMGPTARTVAANLRRLREARGMSLRTLSAEVRKVGRTLSADAINKIENGRPQDEDVSPKQIRRADVDDLVALALALNVSPLTLLLPDESNDQPAKLTDEYQVSSRTAWQWAEGQRTAMDWEPGEGVSLAEPGADPAIAHESMERELEFGRRQNEYRQLAQPEARRRTDAHPAIRLVRNLEDVVENLVMPEPGADRAGLAALGRMAKRRHAQLGFDLEEIIEQLPPAHPGVPLPERPATGQDE
jgi:transcriptional regulator with XRE-family HTH domain